ncbi:MAG: tetratricopeptide repeat protein [Chloroflexota bacterium]
MSDFTFGEWLKRQRKAAGFTQERLAQQVGCAVITLRKIEAEERHPSEQIAARLADIFAVPQTERVNFLKFARGLGDPVPIEPAASPWNTPAPTARMPATITSLIGREKEIAEIRAYLQTPDTRLVTLIGPPGIGKTRLSLETAHASSADFPDGVAFAALAPLDDPSLVASAIVQALGYSESKTQPILQQLKNVIGQKRMLIVLDNCEHLIEDVAPLASDLLLTCPRLTILTTSRESLRVPGEWLYPVPPLDLPRAGQPVDASAAAQFPALTLFAERARAVRPDFKITAENAQAVASICIQLDGLPLAIELLASRMRLMSPQALLERMSNQLVLAADGMRAVTARQKTLNNAIGWTYNFLPADEQTLFARLSVFSGGFALETAEAVFSEAFQGTSVSSLVMSLVDKSLLQRALDRRGETRFGMLVTIQQFGLNRLRDMGLEAETRDRHLSHFLAFAKKGDVEMRGPHQALWADHFESEYANFHAALEWSVSAQKTESALRLLCALGWPWEVRGHYTEAHNWLERIRALPDVGAYPLIHARLLNHLGRYAWTQDRFDEARALLGESQSIATCLGAEGELCLAEALNWMGLLAHLTDGESLSAKSMFERSLALNQKWGDQKSAALSAFHLGIVESDLNNAETAFSLFQKSLSLFEKFGDLFFISRVSLFLGYLFMKQGNYEQAQGCFERHLRLDTEIQFWDGIAEGWRDLGNLHRKQGNLEKAEEYYEQGRAVCRERGLNKTIP